MNVLRPMARLRHGSRRTSFQGRSQPTHPQNGSSGGETSSSKCSRHGVRFAWRVNFLTNPLFASIKAPRDSRVRQGACRVWWRRWDAACSCGVQAMACSKFPRTTHGNCDGRATYVCTTLHNLTLTLARRKLAQRILHTPAKRKVSSGERDELRSQRTGKACAHLEQLVHGRLAHGEQSRRRHHGKHGKEHRAIGVYWRAVRMSNVVDGKVSCQRVEVHDVAHAVHHVRLERARRGFAASLQVECHAHFFTLWTQRESSLRRIDREGQVGRKLQHHGDENVGGKNTRMWPLGRELVERLRLAKAEE
mmetsp:Transcript_9477/g.21446  ORF Transcript_9477/g.21446 Transcript_9477/m.21446 type:complete len:306 (+) Transcript_9477:674-1591(+)